jgi:peroxiredoxin
MLVEDGVVRTLDIDPAGTFDKTDARTMLNHLD